MVVIDFAELLKEERAARRRQPGAAIPTLSTGPPQTTASDPAHNGPQSAPNQVCAISLCRLSLGAEGSFIELEQEVEGTEAAVVWDCARCLIAHALVQQQRDPTFWHGKRVLEIGSGTGAVGLALARLGAALVVLTDLPVVHALLERNVARNLSAPVDGGLPMVRVHDLSWGDRWAEDCDPSLAMPGAFDVIVVCDCVYPGHSSLHLARTLKDLLCRNPKAHVLLGYERRSFSGLPPGTDFYAEFFTGMRAECRVDPVPEEELDPDFRCDEITLIRLALASGGAPSPIA